MPIIQFSKLWNNHPYPLSPCNTSVFENQCAIRMGVSLEKSGVDTNGFDKKFPNRRCYPGFKHSPKHILAAQELASWISSVPHIFGHKQVITSDRDKNLKGKNGIIFILNGWGSTDHIDVWNGTTMKGGSSSWIDYGDELWFWELTL